MKDILSAVLRKQRRIERLGENAFCTFCGYSCLESLTAVSKEWLLSHRLPNALLEKHHVVGRAHDSALTITLCLNCHREITEGLMQAGVSMRPERNSHKLVALMLKACAVLFELLAPSFRQWANALEEIAECESND
jgi:hypothetical protein